MGFKSLVALSLLSLFTIVGCSSTARGVADEGSSFRAPEGDYRTNNNNKEVNRQFVREKY